MPMMCVTTRFRLKHCWNLLPMYLAYWRMRGDLRRAPGLIRHCFLLQSPVACCTVSIWESRAALLEYSGAINHVNAVRYAKRSCKETWSACWQIDAVSKYSNEWQGYGQGHWPTLHPHPVYPFHLVQRSQEEAASQ